jgi:hypothetical protein
MVSSTTIKEPLRKKFVLNRTGFDGGSRVQPDAKIENRV